jgi:hypothetical protein
MDTNGEQCESNQHHIGDSILSNDAAHIMGDVIAEIRSGYQNTELNTSASDKEYITALNSLMNSPTKIDGAGMNSSVPNHKAAHEDAYTPGCSQMATNNNTNEVVDNGDGSPVKFEPNREVDIANSSGENEDHPEGGAVNINQTSNTNDTPNYTQETLSYHIGGPGTCLPFFLESFMGWSLCFSCLSVSGYHYAKSILLSSNVFLKLRQRVYGLLSTGRWLLGAGFDANDLTEESQWIPLTTCTRDELNRHSPWQSYLHLLRVLEKEYPETLVPLLALQNDAAKLDGISKTESAPSSTDEMIISNKECYMALKQKADAALIRVLRHDDVCRRLASLAMRPHEVTVETTVTTTTRTAITVSPVMAKSFAESHTATIPTSTSTKTNHIKTTSTLLKQLPHNHLLQRLSEVWNEVLALPTLEEAKTFYRIPSTDPPIAQKNYRANDAHHAYKISLILPAYFEEGAHMQVKLRKALDMACSPEDVEVIIVDAGGCADLELVLNDSSVDSITKHWGRISIVSFTAGGGRGPCLNYGASCATGRVLTFCHSDTSLPIRWDDRILKTLEHGNKDENELRRMGVTRANSCSFLFGIDTSSEGLAMPFSQSLSNYFPPGLRAVETTANLRSYMYSLPYGDSTLSLHACVFFFLGGFPNQCLMEDYELVSLLRLRGALLKKTVYSGGEKLTMMRGQPALCSPRRWQKFGVLYVTYMNSKLVNLYAGSMQLGPNELFRRYYGKEQSKRKSSLSPWEIELAKRLNG